MVGKQYPFKIILASVLFSVNIFSSLKFRFWKNNVNIHFNYTVLMCKILLRIVVGINEPVTGAGQHIGWRKTRNDSWRDSRHVGRNWLSRRRNRGRRKKRRRDRCVRRLSWRGWGRNVSRQHSDDENGCRRSEKRRKKTTRTRSSDVHSWLS